MGNETIYMQDETRIKIPMRALIEQKCFAPLSRILLESLPRSPDLLQQRSTESSPSLVSDPRLEDTTCIRETKSTRGILSMTSATLSWTTVHQHESIQFDLPWNIWILAPAKPPRDRVQVSRWLETFSLNKTMFKTPLRETLSQHLRAEFAAGIIGL